MFPKIGVPQNGWFIMEIPIKKDDLGGKPTIFGNTHMTKLTLPNILGRCLHGEPRSSSSLLPNLRQEFQRTGPEWRYKCHITQRPVLVGRGCSDSYAFSSNPLVIDKDLQPLHVRVRGNIPRRFLINIRKLIYTWNPCGSNKELTQPPPFMAGQPTPAVTYPPRNKGLMSPESGLFLAVERQQGERQPFPSQKTRKTNFNLDNHKTKTGSPKISYASPSI